MDRHELANWIFLAALVVIGVLGNLFHPGLQDSPIAMFKDVIALCKFPAIFFVLQRRASSPEQQKETLAKYDDCVNEMYGIIEREIFSYAFRLGGRFMLETLTGLDFE